MVLTPPIDATFPCCLGCKILNEPVTELVPIEEEHPVTLPRDNQGWGARMAMVCSSQHAYHGGCSDCQGYGGVAHMQPSLVPRCKYLDQCEQEQSHLGRFAKFGLAKEETGDDDSGSDSSHAGEFRFGVGYKRDGRCIHDGGCVLSPLASGESGGTSRWGICWGAWWGKKTKVHWCDQHKYILQKNSHSHMIKSHDWLSQKLQQDIGYPLTRGCLSPMSWEIASTGCSITVSWSGTKRMWRGRSQRMLLRKRSFNRSMFSPINQLHPNN